MARTTVNLAVFGGTAAMLAASIGGIARADGYLGVSDPAPAAEEASTAQAYTLPDGVPDWVATWVEPEPTPASLSVQVGRLAPAGPITLAPAAPLAVPALRPLEVGSLTSPAAAQPVAAAIPTVTAPAVSVPASQPSTPAPQPAAVVAQPTAASTPAPVLVAPPPPPPAPTAAPTRQSTAS